MEVDASFAVLYSQVLLSLLFGGGNVEVHGGSHTNEEEGSGSVGSDFQTTDEVISGVVQSVVNSLKPVVIKSVHNQIIHASYTSKRNVEEVLTRLTHLEGKITRELQALRSDIQAASETSKSNRKVSASNCYDEVERQGSEQSGIYTITVSGKQFEVYCDLETYGGWIVIQRRDDVIPHVNFYRKWNDYKQGFGDLNREFWLGLDKIHALTSPPSTPVRLRVDLEDWEGGKAHAEYDMFRVTDEEDNYRLFVSGYNKQSTAGDSLMKHHSGMAFTTWNKDHDNNFGNCADQQQGAWWYNSCGHSNLNGQYFRGNSSEIDKGVQWYTWKGIKYSLKKVEMKIRPNWRH